MNDSRIGFGTTFTSPLLESLAREAEERCNGTLGRYDAIAAVVLAYVALEAFLNEAMQLAQTLLLQKPAADEESGKPDPKQLEILSRLALKMREAQDQHASVEGRYDLAWEIMTGKPIDRGNGARPSLGILTKLRNALVHLKSEQTEVCHERSEERPRPVAVEHYEQPKYLGFLESKRLLAGRDEQPLWSWIDRVCSVRVANWACETVEQLAADFVSHAPQPADYLDYRQTLEEQSMAAKPNEQLLALGRRLEDS